MYDPIDNTPFVAFQVPTTAEWNVIWDNDTKLAGGDGIEDDAILARHLADASILPEQLVAGTGTSWVWQNWTPTFGNLSGGTLNYSDYAQIGKNIFFRWKYTLGGAGVSGSVTFSLPVTAAANYVLGDVLASSVGLVDATDSTTRYGIVQISSTTDCLIRALNASGTYLVAASLSSTVPFTWANTDTISASGMYRAA